MEETRRAGVYRAGGTNPFASPGELSCPVRVRVLVRVSRLGPRLRLPLRSRRVPECSTCRVNSLRSVSAPGPSHTCPFGSTPRCRPRCCCREYGRGPLRCLSSPSRHSGPASIPCLSSVECRVFHSCAEPPARHLNSDLPPPHHLLRPLKLAPHMDSYRPGSVCSTTIDRRRRSLGHPGIAVHDYDGLFNARILLFRSSLHPVVRLRLGARC